MVVLSIFCVIVSVFLIVGLCVVSDNTIIPLIAFKPFDWTLVYTSITNWLLTVIKGKQKTIDSLDGSRLTDNSNANGLL